MGINEGVVTNPTTTLHFGGLRHDSFSFVFCCFYILWSWAIQVEG